MLTKEGMQIAMRRADGDTEAWIPFDKIRLVFYSHFTRIEIISADGILSIHKGPAVEFNNSLTLDGMRGIKKVDFKQVT